MFRFTQKGDYDEWKVTEDKDTSSPWPLAAATNSSRVSILAASTDPDIAEQDDITYSGPMFWDIDHEDIGIALTSGVELCDKLLSLGVDEGDIEINLSGSKGVHIYIHPKVYSSGRPVKDLPSIQKHLAVELYVPGIDVQVFSAGKGRMVRPPNAKRPDGAYKVPVTLKELREITPEEYKKWVNTPRDMTYVGLRPCVKSPALTKLFADCKAATKRLTKDKYVTIPDELLAKLEGTIPPCLNDLAEGKERDQTAFNRVALNVAKFLAKSSTTPAQVESIVERISERTTSKKYNTAIQRRRHIQALISFVRGNKSYNFSCVGMLSVITTNPCKNCALKDDNGVASLDDASFNNLFVHQSMGQYYADPDFQRVIASFTMEMGSPIIGEESGVIEACEMYIHSSLGGSSYHVKEFSEEAWISKQKFKSEIQGLHGVAFLGSDNDVAKLKLTITKEAIQEIGEMSVKFKHSKVGLHYYRYKGPDNVRDSKHQGTRVYVEKDFSLDSKNFYNTHVLTGTVNCSPAIKGKQFWEPVTDRGNRAFDLLMKTNTPEAIATTLGWFLSNHLKAHFFAIEKRYPLLYVSGIAGVGKNSLIALFMRLACLKGEDALYTLEAPNATKLPFQQGLTNSTTIPRVVNELNQKSVSKTHYKDIIELLKAGFDSQSISKGRIGGGDRNGANVSSVDWVVTSPIVTLSEEPISIPAVLHRGMKVELTPSGMTAGKDAYMALQYDADDLVEVGRWLVSMAIDTDISEVIQFLAKAKLPKEAEDSGIPERLKHGYKILLASYDWAIASMKEGSGFSRKNKKWLVKMRANLVVYLSTYYQNIEDDSSVNEVDRVINDMAVLAYYGSDPKARHQLEHARHYACDGEKLYLDVVTIYPLLVAFKRSLGETLALQSASAFVNSARGLNYYVSDKTVTSFLVYTRDRPVLELDVELLEKANVNCSMFLPPQ